MHVVDDVTRFKAKCTTESSPKLALVKKNMMKTVLQILSQLKKDVFIKSFFSFNSYFYFCFCFSSSIFFIKKKSFKRAIRA